MFVSQKNFIIYLYFFASLICAKSPLKELKFSKKNESYFVTISVQQDTKIASFGIRDDCFGILTKNFLIKNSRDKVLSNDNKLEINISDLKWSIVYEYYVEVITNDGKIFNTENFLFDKKIGNFVLSTESRNKSTRTLN
ncbi:hypothetical protein NBO_28g0047 [Nosema bombycis CQ1]|uniref:Uncharacterized protein n=1 Tax=Nosema bombycis (strain CQ1 / CVCC 102059) TaxID=578461 RepID=R0MNI5_NOSB1|nr:hypothetical protein NBO_28g0047 [Nosema bombycis CQ1]|eukprot:EOB14408.1 hypothetical protein NBO_28g0047 [Nosema bombycis CQ1]